MIEKQRTFKDKLLYIIKLYGEYPNKSIDLLSDSKGYAAKKVCEMEKKELIRKVTNEYVVERMDEKFNRKRKELKKIKRLLPPKNKNTIKLSKSCDGQNEKELTNHIRTGKGWIERNHRVIEVMTSCYEAGIIIEPGNEEKTSLTWNYNSKIAYTILELKKMAGIEFNKATQYRSCAATITPGGGYIIYNIFDNLIEWSISGETKIHDIFYELIRRNGLHVNISSIVFVKDYTLGAKMIMNTDRNIKLSRFVKKEKSIINISSIYDNTYLLPLSREGIKLLYICTKKNWEENLNKLLYMQQMIDNAKKSYADAIDIENQTLYTTFIAGNMIKLMRTYYFIQLHPQYKYVIKVLSFQKKMITELFQNKVIVHSYDINQIVDGMERIEKMTV